MFANVYFSYKQNYMHKLRLFLCFIIMPLGSNKLDPQAVEAFLKKYPHLTEEKIYDAFMYSKRRNPKLLLINPEKIEDFARKYAEKNRRAKLKKDERIAALHEVILNKQALLEKYAGQISEDQFDGAIKAYRSSPVGGLPSDPDSILLLYQKYLEKKKKSLQESRNHRSHAKSELEDKVLNNWQALLTQHAEKITEQQFKDAITYCKNFPIGKKLPTTPELIIEYSNRWEKIKENKREKRAAVREEDHNYESESQNYQVDTLPQKVDQRMKIDFLLH